MSVTFVPAVGREASCPDAGKRSIAFRWFVQRLGPGFEMLRACGNFRENRFVVDVFSEGSRSFAFHPCTRGPARSIHTAPLTT